jgi:hypothetical protein
LFNKKEKEMRKENVIEIQEEVKISQDGKDIILEKGDKIGLLPKKESDGTGVLKQCLKIYINDVPSGSNRSMVPFFSGAKFGADLVSLSKFMIKDYESFLSNVMDALEAEM